MAGLTTAGFEIARLSEIILEQNERAKEVFQDQVIPGDEVDVSPSTTIGRLIGLNAAQIADLWELAQAVYSAFDPNSATGIALDNLVALNGTIREGATATTVDAVIWGNNNLLLSNSAKARSTNGDNYTLVSTLNLRYNSNIGFRVTLPTYTVGDVLSITIIRDNTSITVSHTVEAGDTNITILTDLMNQLQVYSFFVVSVVANELIVESESIYVSMNISTNLTVTKLKGRVLFVNDQVGNLPIEANTLNIIATPTLGWDSINNPFAGTTGQDQETDDELRERFRQNKYVIAQNISDALYSDLVDIPDVSQVRIYENNTDDYVSDYDLPGHSFKALVLGGSTSEIANVIWLNQPLGISSEGSTEVEIVDSQGFSQIVRFERPNPVDIYISMDISSITAGSLPSNAENTIRASLITYFQTLGLNSEIVYSRLFTPINETPGFMVNSLLIGTTNPPTSESNIQLAYNEYPRLSSENIIITIT